MTDLADRLQDAIDGYEIERVIGEGGMAEVVWQRGVMSTSFCLDQSTWLAYPRHVGRKGGSK